jgi:integrase
MGLVKRGDGWYVELHVVESSDGNTLRLARGTAGARRKRWKVGRGSSKTAARQVESAIKMRLLLGQEPSERAKPVLFKEWAKTYLNLESVKTLRSYQDRVEIMDRQLVPFFGAKILVEIKAADVETYRGQRRRRDGNPASIQTVNNDHTVLKHCLNVAVRRGLIVGNVAARVPMPNPQNERDRVLTEGEWERLYEAAKPHLQPVLLTAYQLGQRFGEITGLTWDRVDLKRGFITLRALDTKTKKARQLPILPDVKAVLQRLAKVRKLTAKQDASTRHVFTYAGRPLQRVTRSFKAALKDAGITDFRFHDLRHCASTNLRRAGVDTATAMKIIGHSSEKMWKRYNAIDEGDLTKAAEKLNRYLQGEHAREHVVELTNQPIKLSS